MTDDNELPAEESVQTDEGEVVTVRGSVDSVSVSASRKVQLDQYEPVEAYVELEATKEPTLNEQQFNTWLANLSELAMAEAERAAMERHEEYVREEMFGDE